MLSFPTYCGLSSVEIIIGCPLGHLRLQTCSYGVHSLQFIDKGLSCLPKISSTNDAVTVNSATTICDPAALVLSWLEAYFGDPTKLESVRMPNFCFLPPANGQIRFADAVLRELMNVRVGETVTYGELGKITGREKASRAVGQVMRSNPVCLLIPCHRVVLKSGKIGHYGGGSMDRIKAWLLDYEAGISNWQTEKFLE